MTALILVDLQNDFLPGGALAIAEGNQILPIVNELLKLPFDCIVATKDWHPEDHGSFADIHNKSPGERVILNNLDQILWPTHCVQGTKGAEFSSEWTSRQVEKVFFKGTDPFVDNYSAFFDNGHYKSTGLDEYLKEKGVDAVFIAGLATDYCVKYSALDALKLGFQVHVIKDACRGVNLNPKDSDQALEEIKQAGAKIVHLHEVKKKIAGVKKPRRYRGGGI